MNVAAHRSKVTNRKMRTTFISHLFVNLIPASRNEKKNYFLKKILEIH